MTKSHRREIGFVLTFGLVFAALQYAYSLCRATPVEHLLIDTLTVKPSAYLINAISPGEKVLAVGHSLVSPWVSLNVLNGCEGMESMLLVGSAMLAYWGKPLPARLRGAAVAVALLYGLNQVRLCTLYFAARHDQHVFALIHGYIGPTLIVLCGSLFFLWWVSRHRTDHQ